MVRRYVGIVALAERLHRRALDLLAAELTRRRVSDLSASQAMILIQMGSEEMTVGELTVRGCYLGTNVSYSLKKLIENGYVVQAPSKHDRRSINVRASRKGHQLLAQLHQFYTALDEELIRSGVNDTLLTRCEAGLSRLDLFSRDRLSGLGATSRSDPAASRGPQKPTPAVPVEKSITPEAIISLEDGKPYKSLRSHLTRLGMTPQQYREKWGLPQDYPMVASSSATGQSARAKKAGVGQQRRQGAKPSATAEATTAPTKRRGSRK